jgi:hypothetical protein
MYTTEKTICLLWEGSKTFLLPPISFVSLERERSRSPFVRSRSPSLESPRGSTRITNRHRPDRQYISYDSLKVLNDFEELLKDWREVSEEYITNTLNISYNVHYKILNVFIKDDRKVLFKVLVHEVNLDTITTKIINSIKLPVTILSVSITDKYSVHPNTFSIRVNCCLSYIPIFKIMGRDKFSFTIQLNELDDANIKCFDAFRNLCKCDKILNDLFEKCVYGYVEKSKDYVSCIVDKFMDVTK